MALHRINEASFDLPDGWQDRSVHIFTAGDGPPFQMNLVMTKDSLKDATDLAEFAERRLDQIETQLKQFSLIEKRQIELGGNVALEIEFKWRSDQGTMHQRMIFLELGREVLVITATASLEIKPHQREQIDALLATFRLSVG